MDIVNSYVPTSQQERAHKASQRYKLYGGAMGGGKSRWLCEEAVELCMQYPGNRGVLARYHLTDFKNSTLKTLIDKVLTKFPETFYQHNKADNYIKFSNGSEIIYMGLSEEEAVSKLKSMELGFFAFDESSEIPYDTFLMAQSRLRHTLPNGKRPLYFGLCASNPDDCWLKDYFLYGQNEDTIFVPALPKDNPFLPSDYEARLRKTYPEDWVKRFLEGSWDDLTSINKLIPIDLIKAAVDREVVITNRPVIGADIARYGDDETIIMYGKGSVLYETISTRKTDTMETVGRIFNLATKNKVRLIGVDDIGVGGGVTDRLREMKCRVLAINSSVASSDEKYGNLRTEMWYHALELFQKGEVSIPNDGQLIRQLNSVKYKFKSNGKLELVSKEETKKELRMSPDRADALIYMLWTAKHIHDPASDFKRRLGLEWKTKKAKKGNSYGWKYQE